MNKEIKSTIQITLFALLMVLILILILNFIPDNIHYEQIPLYPTTTIRTYKKPSYKIINVTNNNIEVEITDENEERLEFTNYFFLEHDIGGAYESVRGENGSICGQEGTFLYNSLIADENNKLKKIYSWEKQCGKMPSGNYRICAPYYIQNNVKSNLCMEFTID